MCEVKIWILCVRAVDRLDLSLVVQGWPSVIPVKPSESTFAPWGELCDRVQEVKWLCGFFYPSILQRKSAQTLSKCKLETSLLCAALAEHWHSTVSLAGWVGTVESAGSGWMSSALVGPQSSLALNSSCSRMNVLVQSTTLKSLFLRRYIQYVWNTEYKCSSSIQKD